MPINRAYVGHEFAADEPYEVSRVKIREFAEAIGDRSPLRTDREAARRAGHSDVVAPPTFPMVFAGIGAANSPLFEADFGMDYSRVLHGEQDFDYSRPIVAGDVLTVTGRVADVRDAGDHELIRTELDIHDGDGQWVCRAVTVLMSTGTAG
ncbi:MaoC family dehydratase [Allosaccharopolyspora coralli]|uniref:MaoC family dehydratase n=1 Tax=Allosaccharopolyspora coralli TaxID=2665642 RepID=A0A5Q3QB05_9PSEU|nr:MaoC family dehydratase N-terminal domain-containing protein [Allosaccharopolyspora coralli]QGK70394.1 MaoC family dehydratase [Allosaccharopolyspora coralli]